MKYKYYDESNRLIAESDSPIQFNVARFPVWKALKPVVEEEVANKVTKDYGAKKDSKKKEGDK